MPSSRKSGRVEDLVAANDDVALAEMYVDLEAENERLREALSKIVTYQPCTITDIKSKHDEFCAFHTAREALYAQSQPEEQTERFPLELWAEKSDLPAESQPSGQDDG